MPQYELDAPGAAGLHRGRDATDAVARATGCDRAAVEVAPGADDAGWQAVTVDGRPAGRVRDHAARMRFRRD